jgi:hypothetical protein
MSMQLRRLECRDGRWGIAHRQLIWDWNHDAPAAEHWMQGLLAPDPSVLRMSAKYPADPIYAAASPAKLPVSSAS